MQGLFVHEVGGRERTRAPAPLSIRARSASSTSPPVRGRSIDASPFELVVRALAIAVVAASSSTSSVTSTTKQRKLRRSRRRGRSVATHRIVLNDTLERIIPQHQLLHLGTGSAYPRLSFFDAAEREIFYDVASRIAGTIVERSVQRRITDRPRRTVVMIPLQLLLKFSPGSAAPLHPRQSAIVQHEREGGPDEPVPDDAIVPPPPHQYSGIGIENRIIDQAVSGHLIVQIQCLDMRISQGRIFGHSYPPEDVVGDDVAPLRVRSSGVERSGVDPLVAQIGERVGIDDAIVAASRYARMGRVAHGVPRYDVTASVETYSEHIRALPTGVISNFIPTDGNSGGHQRRSISSPYVYAAARASFDRHSGDIAIASVDQYDGGGGIVPPAGIGDAPAEYPYAARVGEMQGRPAGHREVHSRKCDVRDVMTYD
mmetsp:Transcript_54811/g.164033  ORF Transcript_54811/g.164033 Transcript_54811/m.164033 type:complete len:428 (+) Transcript_54811:146-1429(+)